MMLRSIAAILLAFAVTCRAPACECRNPLPPLKALAQADAVFSGEIVDIMPKSHDVPDEQMVDGFKATVRVIKSWKGNLSGTVIVHTGSGFGDCGIEFKEEAYLFYVYRDKDGGWQTHTCTRTAPLKLTGEETLELDGRLPIPKDPPLEPVFKLMGKINDAGYNGYVFTLLNRLHERIFYPGNRPFGSPIQVRHHGRWIDKGLSRSDPQLRKLIDLEREDRPLFLDRLKVTTIFVPQLAGAAAWRLGCQYLTESEVDAGAKLKKSRHRIWSAPITPDTPAKLLSFQEAFQNDG